MDHEFKVGDKVRVVLPGNINYGKETTVRRVDVPGRSLGGRFVGIEVDIVRSTMTGTAYPYFVYRKESLEPIESVDDEFDLEEDTWEALPGGGYGQVTG